MNQNKPQPYAYVYLAVLIVLAIAVLWLVWKIIRRLFPFVAAIVVIGLAIYGFTQLPYIKKK